jgi:hypothetical protein
MRIFVRLFKASVIAALVFAIFWIRFPQFSLSLRIAGGVFLAFGIPIVIMALMIGFPLAVVMAKYRIVRWWSTTSVGAVVGASLGCLFSYGAWRGAEPGEVENPFLFTFSPLHWQAPGFTNGITFTLADLVASVSMAAAVGAVLGFLFWYFYSHDAFGRKFAADQIK